MKKLALFATVLVVATASYGQGTTTFANSSGTAVTNSVTTQRVVAGNFRVSLYYLPWTSDSAVPTTADFDSADTAATTPFLGNGIFNNGGQPVTSSGITPAGGIGWFQVRVWELAFGADYATAASRIGALVGTSNIIKVDTGNPNIAGDQPGSILIGSALTGGLKGFSVYPVVPEPTAIALGLLGLGSLLFLRRRK